MPYGGGKRMRAPVGRILPPPKGKGMEYDKSKAVLL